MALLRRFIVISAILYAFLLPAVVTATPNKHPPLPQPSSKLVAKLCADKEVDSHRFCLKALAGPNAAAAKDMRALAKVVLDAGGANAKTTLAVIVGMMNKKPAAAEATLVALRECAKSYEAAVNSFEIVKTELGDPMSANYDVGVTRDGLVICEDAIRAGKVVAPRLFIGNRFLENYISMGSAVTNLMPAVKYN